MSCTNHEDLPEGPYLLVAGAAVAACISSIRDARIVDRHSFLLVIDTTEEEIVAEDLADLAEFADCGMDDVFVRALDGDRVIVELTNTCFDFLESLAPSKPAREPLSTRSNTEWPGPMSDFVRR